MTNWNPLVVIESVMELDQLQNFLKVAERLNFTRAAAELSISQSALSRSIARLEQHLQQPLFERLGRQLQLTDTGRLMQLRAQQILLLVEDTLAELSDDGQTGRIRLGVIPTIAPFLLPGLLQKFASDFPQAQVLVQEDTTEELLKRCQQGELDLLILVLPISEKYLETEVLFAEELLVVMPQEHPLATQTQIQLVDLETYPFVLLAEAHCLSDNILTFCRQRSFHPVSIERTTQLATIQELVALRHGISLIPAMARARDESPRRVYRSLSGTPPTRTIALVWHPYRFQSRLVSAFLEHLRQYTRAEFSDQQT